MGMTQREMLRRIEDRKVPMALVPRAVANDVTARLVAVDMVERRTRRDLFILLCFVCVGATIVHFSLRFPQFRDYFFAAFGVAALATFLALLFLDDFCIGIGVNQGKLPGINMNMSEFGEAFRPFLEALGDKGKEMGDWPLKQVADYACHNGLALPAFAGQA